MNKEQGSIAVILSVVFGVLFIGMTVFGTWAFLGRQDYKDNVDTKIDTAVGVAVQDAETAKDAEFLESEKQPTRVYTGSATYGSLSFSYPKTWSIYVEENTSGTVLDVYGHPFTLPGLKSDQPYAFRAEILDKSYDTTVAAFTKDVEKGIITSASFRPVKVQTALGVRIDGLIEKDVTGAAVYLPLRDRTIKLSSQAPQFLNDFNTIVLPSITFVP